MALVVLAVVLVVASIGFISRPFRTRERVEEVDMTNTVDYRKFSCGFPEEWDDFDKRHRLFLERFPKLIAALNIAFIRQTTLSEHIDKFVFLYGRLCCEDFFEIGLCSGN